MTEVAHRHTIKSKAANNLAGRFTTSFRTSQIKKKNGKASHPVLVCVKIKPINTTTTMSHLNKRSALGQDVSVHRVENIIMSLINKIRLQ